MNILSAFIVGLVFGLGLIVSGMGNPAKVLGFLNLAGAWDPSLAFVMGGAIAVGLVAFRIGGQRARSFLGHPMQIPTARQLDKRLVIGNALFGIGWGLAGICPGPGFILVGSGIPQGLVFVLAMLAGMLAFQLLPKR